MNKKFKPFAKFYMESYNISYVKYKFQKYLHGKNEFINVNLDNLIFFNYNIYRTNFCYEEVEYARI